MQHIKWNLVRRTRSSKPAPGFAGSGHTAVEVFSSTAFASTNPFVLMMDDTLDFRPGQPVGEAHPHAGLETVTLVLEGSLDDAAEGRLQAGDAAWMTAARGVVHNEAVIATGYARILQLWVALPRSERSSPPDLQVLPLPTLPVRREPGVELRLYAGQTGTLTSSTRTRVPMTVVDARLAANATVTQDLPGRYRAFVYVIQGTVRVNDEAPLSAGDVGWFECDGLGMTAMALTAANEGARVLLYAGLPLGEQVIQHGPFVAGSQSELIAYFEHYRRGGFARISDVVARDPTADATSSLRR